MFIKDHSINQSINHSPWNQSEVRKRSAVERTTWQQCADQSADFLRQLPTERDQNFRDSETSVRSRLMR